MKAISCAVCFDSSQMLSPFAISAETESHQKIGCSTDRKGSGLRLLGGLFVDEFPASKYFIPDFHPGYPCLLITGGFSSRSRFREGVEIQCQAEAVITRTGFCRLNKRTIG
jgi:hypothetical protein